MNSFRLLVLLCFGCLCLVGCASAQPKVPGESLLLGQTPVDASGVHRAALVSDGLWAAEGDAWKSSLTAVFEGTDAHLTYDLREPRPMAAVSLQGDANDTYVIEISSDGSSWKQLWRAKPVRGAGMLTRRSPQLQALARFVRVRPGEGDGRFSISELAVSSEGPIAPPAAAGHGRLLDERLRDRTLRLGVALILPLLVLRQGSRWWWALLACVPALIALGQWLVSANDAWPVASHAVSLARGVIAAVATLAVARLAFAPRGFAAQRASVAAVLSICAVLAPLAFYNLGQPQFYSRHRGQWSFAHYFDLRQYYPTAKYFPELGYRRIYEADLAAYLDDHPEKSFESIAKTELRDLDTLQVVRAGERRELISSIKQAFSPERWAEYRRDSAWFRDVMGGDYFDTLIDYGGNATPVWIAMARVLFHFMAPSDLAFTLTGLIDVLLLAAMFVAIQRSFGWQALAVTMVVFGANDYVMYGTNWGGATLRHDWLAYTGLGLCALRVDRPLQGGAWLGLATMIRAFPGLAFVGIALPAAWRVLGSVWRERKLPRLSELLRDERETWRAALGAVTAVVVSGLFSLTLVPASAWVDWASKVGQLESEPHPAVVALRNLIAGWEAHQHFLDHRRVVYWAAQALFCGLCVVAARGKRAVQGAVLGLMLLPVVFYPANYYLHLVCVFPLLASLPERTPTPRDAALWVGYLALCAAQYFTVLVSDLGLHFYLTSALTLAVLFVLLCASAHESLEALAEEDPQRS